MLTLGFFLIGAPLDTKETVSGTINYALTSPLDYAQFHKTVAKPGTILYEQVKKNTGRDYWREYILGKVGEERLPSPWTYLSDEEIDKFVIEAYHKFYLRPKRLLRIICGIKSLDEFMRYVRSGLGLMKAKTDLRF